MLTVHILGELAEAHGTRTVHMALLGAELLARGLQVTALVLVAGVRTVKPVGHLLTLAVFPRQPPRTRSQLRGHMMTWLRPQVTPLRDVALVIVYQPEGHLVVPVLRARQPPRTRVKRTGHVSVCS